MLANLFTQQSDEDIGRLIARKETNLRELSIRRPYSRRLEVVSW